MLPLPPKTGTYRRVSGPFVKALREALGMRHGTLATTAGISAGYLTHIEAGTRQPSFAVTADLARALGVPVSCITYPCECRDKVAA